MLGPAGWDSHPPWMDVAGRVRLSWFTSASAGLLIAIRVDGDRVDLLVVPPDTDLATARAAMALAARPTNTIHAPDILTAVTDGQLPPTETVEGNPGRPKAAISRRADVQKGRSPEGPISRRCGAQCNEPAARSLPRRAGR